MKKKPVLTIETRARSVNDEFHAPVPLKTKYPSVAMTSAADVSNMALAKERDYARDRHKRKPAP